MIYLTATQRKQSGLKSEDREVDFQLCVAAGNTVVLHVSSGWALLLEQQTFKANIFLILRLFSVSYITSDAHLHQSQPI